MLLWKQHHPHFVRVMLFFINDSFGPVLCRFINLIVSSCADDNDQHFCFCSDQLIYDTDTGIPEFDFQKPVKSLPCLFPNGFP